MAFNFQFTKTKSNKHSQCLFQNNCFWFFKKNKDHSIKYCCNKKKHKCPGAITIHQDMTMIIKRKDHNCCLNSENLYLNYFS